MLEAGIQALGVFPDDDQIYVGVARWNMGQVADRTEVGVELEFFPQRHVDAGEPFADWRGDGSLQSDVGAFNRFAQFFGNVLAMLLKSLCPCLEDFPIKLEPGSF